MTNLKTAITHYAVVDVIKNRWSPRSFSGKTIPTDALHHVVEAATWIFSANNEQPWRYLVVNNEHPDFKRVLNCLNPGNATWAKYAGAFMVSIAKTTFDKEGNPPNNWAEHDLGAANATLALQATSMGIHAHLMAGFDAAKLKAEFVLPDELKPIAVIALGYLDTPEKLEEPFKTRELSPRTRKSISEIILNHE